MASLQNEQIDQSYQGLIKTANNLGAGAFPPAKLQYGNGAELPILIGDGTGVGIGDIVTLQSGTRSVDLNANNLALNGLTSVSGAAGTVSIVDGTFNFGLGFPGAPATNVDFTNATVTGLPGGAAGLENGTGTSSLQSAASLTVTAANASGLNAIALGEGATASSEGGVAIGESTTADGIDSVAIGRGANSNGESVAIGDGSTNAIQRSIAIGRSATANQNGIAIGNFAQNTGVRSISMASCAINTQTNAADDSIMIVPGSYGTRLDATADRSIIIGAANTDLTRATGADGVVIGFDAQQSSTSGIAIGKAANVGGNYSIVVGDGASATRQESVAIGWNATANGTGSEGSIAIGAGSVASANRGIAIGINGTTNSSEGIVIGDDVDISSSDRSIAIGGAINITGGNDKVAIGTSAAVSGQRGLAFGQNASATANEAIAIGYNVTAAKAQTLSVNNLETLINGGGLTMHSPNGTEYVLTVSDAGALVIT